MMNDYYYVVCFSILLFFFIFGLIICAYPAQIYQFNHVMSFKIKHFLKYGIVKGQLKRNEKEIKKRAKKINVNELIRLLKKYNIDFDMEELKKPSLAIIIKYYKKYLAEKKRKEENDFLDNEIKAKAKIVEDDFDNEAFVKESEERFNAYMKRRNPTKK